MVTAAFEIMTTAKPMANIIGRPILGKFCILNRFSY
jgi:hypothetical protein